MAHLLHVGLLGKGDPGDGVGRDAQLLPVHLAFLHLHDACKGTCQPRGLRQPPTSAAQSSIHLNAAAAEAAMAPRLRGPPGIRREDTAPPIAEAGDVWGDPALLLPRDLTGGCAARGGDLPATLRAAKRPDRRGVRPEEGTPPPPSRPPTPGAARLALLAYQLQEASAHLSQ